MTPIPIFGTFPLWEDLRSIKGFQGPKESIDFVLEDLEDMRVLMILRMSRCYMDLMGPGSSVEWNTISYIKQQVFYFILKHIINEFSKSRLKIIFYTEIKGNGVVLFSWMNSDPIDRNIEYPFLN